MHTKTAPGRRFFTRAAREAAYAVRQANARNRKDRDTLEVFVVRRASSLDPFAWEIRRFGGVVLRRSDAGFPTVTSARADGRIALAREPLS